MRNLASAVQVLRNSTVFGVLDEAALRDVADGCQVTEHEAGEVLWLRGDAPSFVGVLGRGFVRMSQTTPSGREVALELMGPGHTMGLLSAIEGHPLPLDAVAITPVRLLRLRPERAVRAYRESEALKDRLVRRTTERLKTAYGFLARSVSDRVEGRIAAVLLWLVVGVAYTGGDWRSSARRMDFLRFTGEWAIYYA
ncbi:MAG: Crp/Fnr family transcriptional regulator, partial [Fimbriimonadales bacterium]